MKTTPYKSFGAFLAQTTEYDQVRSLFLADCKSKNRLPSTYKTQLSVWDAIYFSLLHHHDKYHCACDVYMAFVEYLRQLEPFDAASDF